MISILVLEDHEDLRDKLANILRGRDSTTKVFFCESKADAVKLISRQTTDVSDRDGTLTMRHFKEVSKEKPVIVISANVDLENTRGNQCRG